MSSKLFQEIREKRFMLQYFFFSKSIFVFWYFWFYSACNPNDLENLLDTSLNEIKI